jgi:uncharacterized membrane protein (UPF0127 family)
MLSNFPSIRTSRKRTAAVGFLVVIAAVSGAAVLLEPNHPSGPVSVTLYNDSDAVAEVAATPAVTRSELVTGLSEHTSLESGHGMLFYHSNTASRSYVMRNMSFGIDIIFITADCQVSRVVTASPPAKNETGTESHHTYTGTAKYVLEVPAGYANSRVSAGDSVSIEGRCGG